MKHVFKADCLTYIPNVCYKCYNSILGSVMILWNTHIKNNHRSLYNVCTSLQFVLVHSGCNLHTEKKSCYLKFSLVFSDLSASKRTYSTFIMPVSFYSQCPFPYLQPKPSPAVSSQSRAPEVLLDQRIITTPLSASHLSVVQMDPPSILAEASKTSMPSAMLTLPSSVVSTVSAAPVVLTGMPTPLTASSSSKSNLLSSPNTASTTVTSAFVDPMGPQLAAPMMPLVTLPTNSLPVTSIPLATAPFSIEARERTVVKPKTSLPVTNEASRAPLSEVATNTEIVPTTSMDRNNGVMPPKIPRVADMAQAPNVLSDCER